MNKLPREPGKRKTLERLLFDISQGTVIVEGRHDTKALKKFNIDSITYAQALKHPDFPKERKVYIFTDKDRRGREKGEKIREILLEEDYKIDDKTGSRILKLLNSSSVEQICAPIIQRLYIENGEYNG